MFYFCRAIAISMKRFSIYTLLTLLAVSCTSSFTEVENGSDMIEVFFGQSTTIGSRTSIADDGAASWSKTDKIALWAAKSDGTFALANQTFSLHHYSTTYDRAVFSSKIPNTLTEQSYTYYATYPVPNSVSGNIATFYLPATQDGSNNLGLRDIMVARPTTGAALNNNEDLNLNLGFTHKMHTLRLQLQDTKLNGVDIDQVILEFPTNVVGDVMVDITNPDAAPTLVRASNIVQIQVPKDYQQGDYLWTTIFPTNISGEIYYRVRAGEYTSRTKSISLEKDMQAQRVTPMSMPVPDPITVVYIEVTDNYLGEEYNTISIYDASNNLLGTYPRNALDTYYLDENINIPAGQVLSLVVKFESESAIVSRAIQTNSPIVLGATHRIPTTVPYLLFEDFTGRGDGESYGNNDYSQSETTQPGASLNSIGLTGWNAARYWTKGGSFRVNVRHQTVNVVFKKYSSQHHGRLDTPTFSHLKKSVNVTVSFKAGGNANSASSFTISSIYISLARHTNSASVIDGIPVGSSGISSNYSTTLADFGTRLYDSSNLGSNFGADDFGNSGYPTHTINNVTLSPSDRLCFFPTMDASGGTLGTGNGEANVYIDDIKVQIVK